MKGEEVLGADGELRNELRHAADGADQDHLLEGAYAAPEHAVGDVQRQGEGGVHHQHQHHRGQRGGAGVQRGAERDGRGQREEGHGPHRIEGEDAPDGHHPQHQEGHQQVDRQPILADGDREALQEDRGEQSHDQTAAHHPGVFGFRGIPQSRAKGWHHGWICIVRREGLTQSREKPGGFGLLPDFCAAQNTMLKAAG
ncbi:hypothetical protein [Teichococcus aestuarii]|uniref:hypothetical protein n=1 Tax=Teichococcus aestuarii TaxID=568898 RepID=UPI003624645A